MKKNGHHIRSRFSVQQNGRPTMDQTPGITNECLKGLCCSCCCASFITESQTIDFDDLL